MIRREFITLIGGAAAWPLAAHAEQRDQQARVGILTQGGALENPRFAAFRQEMRRLGYVEAAIWSLNSARLRTIPNDCRNLLQNWFDCRSTSYLWKVPGPLGRPRRRRQASQS